MVREQLHKTIGTEFQDVFPDQLPYGPPPKRVIDHEIETTPGETPPHKSPYRLSVAEQDELRRQIDTLCWNKGGYDQVLHHMGHQFCLSRKRMENGGCALIIGL